MSVSLMLYALLLVGEAAWIFGWTLSIGAWIGGSRAPLLPLPVLLGLLLVPAVLARGTSGARGHMRHLVLGSTMVLGIAAAIGAAITQLPLDAGIPTDLASLNRWLEGERGGRALLAGMAAGLTWRRGLGKGARPDVSTVDESFGMGIVAMSSLLAVVGLSSGATHVSSDALIPSTLAVLAAGLIGMPLARIGEVSSRPRHQHGHGLTLGGPWLVMLLTVVATILVMTLALAKLFTFERITAVLDAVGGAVDSWLRTAIYILAIPFGLLVQALVFLARLLIRPGTERPHQQPVTDLADQLRQHAQTGEVSPAVLLALKVVLGVVMAALLAWITWRAISRLQRMWGDDDVDEDRDSIWSWPDWSDVWSWIVSRLSPVRNRASALLLHHSPGAREADHSVRGVYRELLRLGAAIGHPRRLPETPLEYQDRLGRVAPEGSAEAARISEAYTLARYGPPTVAADIAPLAEALARLRVLWRGRIRS